MQPAREQSIRKKIGSIFSLGTPRSNPAPQKSHDDHVNLEQSPFITEDVLRELERSVPTQHRVRALKELHDIVSTKRLEEHAVKSIWLSIQDLIEPSQSMEVRHTTLIFLKALIYGQFDDLGILRAHFFNVVRDHNVPEDTQERFDVLRVLTFDGKNILHLEQDIGRFLLEWMPEFVTIGKANDFVSLLVNFVHYNAAYLDQDVLIGLVQLCCVLANKSTLPNVISLCLDFMNAVVCYSSLPADSIHTFVITLCNTLNIERFSKKSLDVMLRLLGTHLGRSTIYSMCSLIQERSSGQEALLLRGAVFYISMSMWGVRRVKLDLSFASVLPSIKQAVHSGHTIVVYEVSLSLLRLVRAHARHLHPLEWEAVYDTIAAIQGHMTHLEGVEPGGSSRSSLGQCLRDLFVTIEQLYESGANIGSPDQFFELVEGSLDTMPVQSVLALLSYRTTMAHAAEDGWLSAIKQCMDKFYRCEKRTAVRVEALKCLGRIVEEAFTEERELMEGVVLPLLEPIGGDSDEGVRCQGAQLLVHLLLVTEPEWGPRILSILSSLLQAGMHTATNKALENPRLSDSKAAVFGLTEAFQSKLQSSSPTAAQIYSLLVSLVNQHYHEGCFLPTAGVMRVKIFHCLLSLRCNEFSQLGYQDEDTVTFTPFFTCRAPDETTPTDHSPTFLDYKSAFNSIMDCLKKEQEQEVLVQVLCDLVPLLQDRHLTLSTLPELSMLTTHLCELTSDHTHSPPPPWSRTDVALHVYPVLTILATYPSHMDRGAQERLVMSLDAGLVGKGAKSCVAGLGLCALQLQTTMRRLLPRVLHRLGQIAATPTLAVPVLEFLSGLVPTPSLHRGFVEQEYLSVFAIALPYTNHQKYTPYVIALAHRVVAQWFVSCRLQYRPTIASFILKHLARDVGYQPVSCEGGVGVELVEVCRDMLARYTYSNVSALPVRSSGAEFLLDGGPTKTWCVGNTLVTITTSRRNNRQCPRCQTTDNITDSELNVNKEPCSCVCRGWAEVLIHRPTGDVSWVMRLQNLMVPADSEESAYDSGYGLNDGGILALHRPVNQDHESFEDLSGETNVGELRVSSAEDLSGERGVTPVEVVTLDEGVSGVRDVTPVQDDREVTPVNDVTPEAKSDKPHADVSSVLSGHHETDYHESDQKSTKTDLQEKITETLTNSSSVVSTKEEAALSIGEIPTVEEDFGSPDQQVIGPESWPESVASLSTISVLEHLPPLLSYDKEEELGRSPPLMNQQLSEQDQLQLRADLSDLSSSTDSLLTGSSSDSGDELSSWEYASTHAPRIKHKSLSLPEDSPSSHVTVLPPPPMTTPPPAAQVTLPAPQRRKSAPATPIERSPAQQRKRVLYSHQPPRTPQPGGEEHNDPSFVFLQLYQTSFSFLDPPLLLPNNEGTERAMKNLNRIHPYETHKIGVLYVGRGQSSETEILANTFGSSRYLEFLKGLGSLLRLPDAPPRLVYLGGLDQSGTDGKVTYCYHNNISQVIYHVATLMPTDLTSDPMCSYKKLHIGNDFVTVVYNDSGSKYKFGTLKGQFNFAEVVVEPHPGGVNMVVIQGRSEIQRLVGGDPVFVSDTWLPQLVRQKALQADLASHVVASETRGSEHYLTNWLGRLRQIRKIRDKCLHDITTIKKTTHFTEYT